MVPDLTDEIDAGNFFDQIDDLIDFSPDLKCDIVDGFMASYDAKGISTLWADPFSKADPLFSGDISPDLSAELSIPYEDIVQLEWLSTFVEESYSPCGEKTEAVKNHFHTSSPLSVLETSTSSSSSNTSSSSSGKPASFSTNPPHGAQRARSKRPRLATLVVWPTIHLVDSAPAKKKMNKTGFGDDGSVRKCMHCEITTTPQWRVGPMGPKTLCNACGVRHKSGRLFPEYRPAASPTFVPSLHSNSHKKVLEMRCKGDNASKPPLVANP